MEMFNILTKGKTKTSPRNYMATGFYLKPIESKQSYLTLCSERILLFADEY